MMTSIAPLLVIGPPEMEIPVPAVSETLVTVPTYWSEEEIVKLGYVPVIVVVPPCVRTTVWSGAVLVTSIVPLDVTGPPEIEMPIPAVSATLVTVPPTSSDDSVPPV